MNGRQQSLVLLVHGIIACVLIAAATFLSFEHDLDGQSLAVILGGALGLVGGSAGSFAILGLSNGKATAAAAAAPTVEAQATPVAPVAPAPVTPTVVEVPPSPGVTQ